MGELAENMTTNLGQYLGLVGTDVKHLLLLLSFKGIQTHGKYRQLARAAGGFKQPIRVGVIARRGVRVDFAHPGNVVMIVGVAAVMQHIAVLDPLIVQLAEDLFRGHAKIDTQMVHQLQLAALIDASEQGHFGVRRAALHQRAAGVIADPANHRGANAR
ncbi:hypothetical protein D3C75_697860 [compost metagenome]